MKGMNKRAAAHVEMVSAFILFFLFVFFLLLILKPYETTSISPTIVSGIYDSFEKRVTTNLTQAFLMADTSRLLLLNPLPTCFKIELPDGIITYDLTSSKSIVTALSGYKFDSAFEKEQGNLGEVFIKNMGAIYYKLALSPEFTEGGTIPGNQCGSLDEDYLFGSIVERQIVSQKAILEMKTEYLGNYESLKTELRVPSTYDFEIRFDGYPEWDMSGAVILDPEIIEAREYVAEVLFGNGTVINTVVNIRIG